MFSGQEMFERIDKEEDGEVYLREVVDFLAVLDNNIEQSHQVRLGFIENDTWARGPEEIQSMIHFVDVPNLEIRV